MPTRTRQNSSSVSPPATNSPTMTMRFEAKKYAKSVARVSAAEIAAILSASTSPAIAVAPFTTPATTPTLKTNSGVG